MIDPNAPAFPHPPYSADQMRWSDGGPGLTIRCEFATRMMAGLLANPILSTQASNWGPENYAQAAVTMTDALIDRLNQICS